MRYPTTFRPSRSHTRYPGDCDPHLALARSESRETRLVCGTCGRRAEGNYSDDNGHVCDACIKTANPDEVTS